MLEHNLFYTQDPDSCGLYYLDTVNQNGCPKSFDYASEGITYKSLRNASSPLKKLKANMVFNNRRNVMSYAILNGEFLYSYNGRYTICDDKSSKFDLDLYKTYYDFNNFDGVNTEIKYVFEYKKQTNR